MNPPSKNTPRRRISQLEGFFSVAILLGLVAIGVAIAIKGRHYDPRIFELDPEALAATSAPVPGSGNQPAPSSRASLLSPSASPSPVAPGAETVEGYAAAAQTAPTTGGGELEPPSPDFVPQGKTEIYGPDTLYEKIDGQAEGYLSFKFQRLRARSFTIPGGSIDIYEYDMGEPINAYGIFARERDAAAPPIDFAPDGYQSGLGYFLRQGKFYVQVLASDQKPDLLILAERAARAMAQRLPVDDTGLGGRKMLPTEGLDAASLTFTLTDGFGIPGLSNVFQGQYAFAGRKLTFFVAILPDIATAERVFTEARKISAQFGKVTDEPAIGTATLFSAESFGQWKVLYRRGDQIGGVMDADQLEAAREFVNAHLKAAKP